MTLAGGHGVGWGYESVLNLVALSFSMFAGLMNWVPVVGMSSGVVQ